MSELEREIKEVEVTIEHCKEMKDRAAAVRRLSKNKDFKLIIEEGLIDGEAKRLAHLYSEPAVVADPAKLEMVRVDLQSVGFVRRYLGTLISLGDRAEQEIMSHQNTLDELRTIDPEEYEEEDD